MTTPDTRIPGTTTEVTTTVQETAPTKTMEPAGTAVDSTPESAPEDTANDVATAMVAETQAPAVETATEEVVVAAATGTVATTEEEPQNTVFSLVTFFLAALPVIGVILNSIAVARAGKEGFDLWLARWGLALAIIETVGALALLGLGYYLGMLTAGTA